MQILAFSVLNSKFEVVLHQTAVHTISLQDMEVIANFLHSINSFGYELFDHKLSRVALNGLWIDFLHMDKYILATIVSIDSSMTHSDEKMYNIIISQIEEFLREMIDVHEYNFIDERFLEFFSSYFDMKIAAIAIGMDKYKFPERREIGEDSFIEKYILIAEPSGIPVYHKKYTEIEIDSYLIAMLFTSLSNFASSELNSDLSVIHYGTTKINFKNNDELMIIIIYDSLGKEMKSMSSILKAKMNKFFSHLTESYISSVNSQTDIDPIKFKAVLDVHLNNKDF